MPTGLIVKEYKIVNLQIRCLYPDNSNAGNLNMDFKFDIDCEYVFGEYKRNGLGIRFIKDLFRKHPKKFTVIHWDVPTTVFEEKVFWSFSRNWMYKYLKFEIYNENCFIFCVKTPVVNSGVEYKLVIDGCECVGESAF